MAIPNITQFVGIHTCKGESEGVRGIMARLGNAFLYMCRDGKD